MQVVLGVLRVGVVSVSAGAATRSAFHSSSDVTDVYFCSRIHS